MLTRTPAQNAVANGRRAFDAPRSYLFVSSREPLAAAAALWSWADGPPDLCVTSPSHEAQDTAEFATAGHIVTTLDEPMLARRQPNESWDDFRARYSEALLIVSAYDTAAALLVCDQFPDRWRVPFTVDAEGILKRAALLDTEVPLP
jgi:hypothetical protein